MTVLLCGSGECLRLRVFLRCATSWPPGAAAKDHEPIAEQAHGPKATAKQRQRARYGCGRGNDLDPRAVDAKRIETTDKKLLADHERRTVGNERTKASLLQQEFQRSV